MSGMADIDEVCPICKCYIGHWEECPDKRHHDRCCPRRADGE